MTNYREINRENMINFFRNGCKKSDSPLRFGLELEHFVVCNFTKESIPYEGEHGIEELLEKLAPLYLNMQKSENHLIGLSRDGIALSLEPAAQLEVSLSPQQNIQNMVVIYDNFYKETSAVLEEWGYSLVTLGYQPKSKVEDLNLIPKKRYEYMDLYFKKIGPYGRQMMKGTASTQVSIDYYSEEDFSKKYGLAYRLMDILGSLCQNTPVYEGTPLKHEILKGQIPRFLIWENIDPVRVDIEPFFQDDSLDFYGYTEFVMHTPVIVEKIRDKEFYCEETIGEICEKRILNEEEIEHVLSMVFPMIRLKNYIEIRYADSMPIGSAACYSILLKGLFTNVDKTLDVLNKMELCNKSNYNILKEIMPIIEEEISTEEKEYLSAYQEEIKNGTIIK